VSCRLGTQPRIEQVVLTDGRGSESLRRFACGADEVEVVDRGYAKAGDLDDVLQRGGDFIVRIGWNSVRLCTADGKPFDLFAFLDGIPEEAVAEISLAVALDRNATQLRPVRLVVKRLSKTAAERSKRRARRKSSKQGRTLQPQTLRAAGYVMLLTSLDASELSAADILAIYRLRWQIELLFKRLKSLLDLDALPTKQPDLARCWIYAKLIAALLLEEMADIFLDSSPCAEAEQRIFALAPAAAAA
jgi:IS4 transposase